jgi:phage terminase large subunit-like protein
LATKERGKAAARRLKKHAGRPQWTTACPDWADRLRRRQSIIPPPIYKDQAAQALAIFKELRVVDLPGKPTFGECSEQWVFDFVAAIFGAYDADTGKQLIREFYLLISKKNTKSTIAAGIMLTAVILCWREEEEHLILAPTKEVADNSFKPAAGMIRADEELAALFHVQDHVRTITHRVTRASLKVVAADTDTVSGKKSGRVLVDEHWLFGKQSKAEAMFMEATGGQVSRDEGWVIYLTTQSDEPPAGVFKDKLNYYRDVRDGKIVDPKSLGVLYEFPPDMIASKAYLDPANFYITNPNMGRSVSAEWLEDQLEKVRHKADGTFQQFLAKHLNVEIGLNLRSDRWAGADFWEEAEIVLSLDDLIRRCEVIVAGGDGGGLDDLLGQAFVGRERETGKWLAWFHAWAHRIVLERRKEIAPRLLDFQREGCLTIVDRPGQDVEEFADNICRVRDAGLLPEQRGIGVDAAGIGDIVDELAARDFDIEKDIVAISQGWRLTGAIKTTERKLAGGELLVAKSDLMPWCVSNARIEQQKNAVSINKQISGTAKIDPLMALFDAVSLMALNPAAHGRSFWETA